MKTRPMKTFSIIIISYIFCCSITIAQDWQCIKTDTEYFYGNLTTPNTVTISESIRIDSIYQDGYNTFYKNRTMFRVTGFCHYPNGHSFLGRQVFADTLGFYHFVNNYYDTLHFKTTTELNEEWQFFNKPQSDLRIIARIDSIDTLRFIDIIDSVKFIKFQATNFNGDSISHEINAITLILSKNYGFVSILKFDVCPSEMTNYNMVGIQETFKGYTNFGASEIWDMDPGDEFHRLYYTGSNNWEYIDQIMSRTGKLDSLMVYEIKNIRRNHYWKNGEFHDTIYPPMIYNQIVNFSHSDIKKWNVSPGEAYADGIIGSSFKISSSIDSVYQKKEDLFPHEMHFNDSCYKGFNDDEYTINWAIKGTGTPYSHSFDHYGNSSGSYLKYFKKGDVTWGTPFTFTFPLLTDYQCIKTGTEHFYYHPEGNREDETISTESISIDSIYFENGFTYYQNHLSMRQSEDDCYTPYGYSFLGRKVFSDTTGFFYFINNEGDTLSIKSNAAINESWVFFEDTQSDLRIFATVDSVRNLTFIGITDQAKYINFLATNLAGDTISHPINDETMILSQDHGFVRMFRFDVCPMEMSVLELCGDEDTGKGVTDMGLSEIFNMEPGDEIHEETFYQEAKPAATVYTRNQYIRKLVSKTGSYESAMTFTYDILEHQVYYNSGSGYGQDTIFPHYTKVVTIDFNNPEIAKWNSLPGEAYTDSVSGYLVELFKENAYHSKILTAETEKDNDTCYLLPQVTLNKNYYAVAGTGGMYHYYDNGYDIVSRSDLKYFKKGDQTWGVPFDFGNVGEKEGIDINSILSVYPNPAGDEIVFHLKTPPVDPKTLLLEIYSPTGERITTLEISDQKTEMNISRYKSGIYLYRITNDEVIGTGKFSKR